MEQKNLSKWLKCILLGFGICGCILYAAVIPVLGTDLKTQYPEFSNRFLPWLVFLWISAIPCFAVLFFSRQIASNIGQNRSFSTANANMLKWISMLSAGDAVYFFAGNIVLLVLNMSHPSVVLVSFVIVFIGVAIYVASEVLSHLVVKAAALQDQSGWMI